jgi:hypothetical protein
MHYRLSLFDSCKCATLKISMTTAELGLATKSSATLSTSTTLKALNYHGPGKRTLEDKPRPAIRDPGDAIVRITTSRWGSNASWALSTFTFPGDLPLSKLSL